jgi:hypothetical protein
MKRAAFSLHSLLLAFPLIADLAPGVVVTAGQPFPIVADFNGDGLDDLIQERNVLLSNGTSFGEPRSLPIGDERVVGVLDVNGDGVVDLLTMGTTVMVPPSLPQPPMQAPGYRLYIADAARNYGRPIGISSGAPPGIADVDADGKDDCVILSPVRPDGFHETATDVIVLRSRGDGTFDQLETFRMPAFPQIYPEYRLLVGDLNHDAIPDLVIRCTQDLVVLLGKGGGAFEVHTRHLPIGPAFAPQSTRLADIDGDSNLDVILPSLRGIRVFFGDGKGNFPRTTRGSIAKVHEIGLPPGMEFLVPANANQPRDLALGHFTRTDRMQIAAGTMDGDLVVFSYERGELREDARTPTEFWHLDIRSGSFRGGALDDLYVMGTLIWGDNMPRPRVFNGVDDGAAARVSNGAASRRRSTRSESLDQTLDMQFAGECIDESAARWTFTRDGVFGIAKHGATTIETVFDGPQIYFRLTAPYAQDPAIGSMTEENGWYRGEVNVMTPCGPRWINVTATIE